MGLTSISRRLTSCCAVCVPGLRGNAERTYPVTAVGPGFPGTFDRYVASVIAHWQSGRGSAPLKTLNKHLALLGLTTEVVAKPISDAHVELRVGRLAPGRR